MLLPKEQKLEIDPGEYVVKSLKFGLIHVVCEMGVGCTICELIDAQESDS